MNAGHACLQKNIELLIPPKQQINDSTVKNKKALGAKQMRIVKEFPTVLYQYTQLAVGAEYQYDQAQKTSTKA